MNDIALLKPNETLTRMSQGGWRLATYSGEPWYVRDTSIVINTCVACLLTVGDAHAWRYTSWSSDLKELAVAVSRLSFIKHLREDHGYSRHFAAEAAGRL